MINYWIFVIGNRRDGHELFENKTKFNKVMKRNMVWGLGWRTPNVRRITNGDKGLFYLSGNGWQCIIGQFEISSEAIKIETDNKQNTSPILLYGAGYFVRLKKFRSFKRYVKIANIKNQLELTKKSAFWGTVLQGGTRKISEKDFNYILNISR
ncbi:MAG: EVE domain-containing protein [Candidatus Aenigmarchaeota archaeon]|nr:EVE domain-containing protein [Candidatus Aenigmarchaeota archaeon]